MTEADHFLAGLLVLVCAAQLFLRVDPAAHPRALLYRAGLISGLIFGALPLLVWAMAGRPLARFGLQGWLGDPFLAPWLALLWTVQTALLYRAVRAGRLREPLLALYRRFDYLMPRTRRELRMSWLVSAVAGCGEEIAFRGFLLWYGAVLFGPDAALFGSALLFAAAHRYQGVAGMTVAALAGFLLAILYQFTGSLVLVIWIHCTYNMFSFAVGRQLLAGERPAHPL